MYRYTATDEVRRDVADLIRLQEQSGGAGAAPKGPRPPLPLPPLLDPDDDETLVGKYPPPAWDAELIVQIHRRVLRSAGLEDAVRGFRHSTAPVLDDLSLRPVYTPPPAHAVPALIGELASWAHRWVRLHADAAEHPLPRPTTDLRETTPIVAALVHARFMGIRPFTRENARTAHILAALTMYYGGFTSPRFTTVAQWWERHPDLYREALSCLGDAWNPAADVSSFLTAYVHAQLEHAVALTCRDLVEHRLYEATQALVSTIPGAEPRTAAALWESILHGNVTNRSYRQATGVSVATATNDLGLLESTGLLEAHGAGRSHHYRATLRLLRALCVGLSLEPTHLPHPFTAEEARVALLAATYTSLERSGQFTFCAGRTSQPGAARVRGAEPARSP